MPDAPVVSTLKVGARGPEVLGWQRFLVKQNLLEGPADFLFGDKTAQATGRFQKDHGLGVDGKVGKNGKERPRYDLRRPWASATKKAGLAGVHLHDLRHTFASHLVSRGASLYLVGSLLGHTQAQTTQRYAHLAPDAKLDAANLFGSILEAAQKGAKAEVIPLTRPTGT